MVELGGIGNGGVVVSPSVRSWTLGGTRFPSLGDKGGVNGGDDIYAVECLRKIRCVVIEI